MERHRDERKKQPRVKPTAPQTPAAAVPHGIAPRNEDPFFHSGMLYQNAGNLPAAAACFNRSLQRKPSPEAFTQLGSVLGLMGDLDAAITQCRKAVDLNPEFGVAWNDLGFYYIEKHSYDDAEKCLQKAISARIPGPQAQIYYNLSRCQASRGMVGAALSAIENSLLHDPKAKRAREVRDELARFLH